MSFPKLALLITASLALTPVAAGQQPPASGQASAASPLQKGKVAVINTAVLQEAIGEYKAKIDGLNRQFEPRMKDVQGLTDRINALETTMRSQTGVLPPARIAEMTEQLDQMKREQKRKAEDLQADGERARDQQLAPIKEKLQKFLQDFTTRRGITLVIDLANGMESNAVLWYDRRAEVTQDFVNEYNKANPAQASPPAPKP